MTKASEYIWIVLKRMNLSMTLSPKDTTLNTKEGLKRTAVVGLFRTNKDSTR